MKPNIIQEKSFAFALEIINTCKGLNNQREFVIANQLLKSGTSVGANVEEAIGGQSKKDFVAKLSIAYKEAKESHYWLRLLKESNNLEANKATSLIDMAEELKKILAKIIQTSQQSIS